MEVTTEEETQSVLLEGMDGTQYITIQRTDSEGLSKGVPLFAVNGEIFPEGMVVDMINGVNTDYSNGTQYYETDDLLPQVLTEDDRRLAEALVAVQLQQQQKQQQIQNHSNQDDTTLQDVSHLETLTPVNTYSIETIQEPNPPPVYPLIQTFKRLSQKVKQEFIHIKCEDDIDISAESSEDAVAPISGPKRTLPHKKRIPRKLKQQSKKIVMKKESNNRGNLDTAICETDKFQSNAYKCEICGNKFGGQLKFFEHLKSHYEPVKDEKKATNNIMTIPALHESSVHGVETVIEEFSEPEDIMEGIRGVVEETGAQIDDEEDDEDDVEEDQLPDSNNSSSMWTISEVQEQTNPIEMDEPSTINDDFFESGDANVTEVIKKKKIKTKKLADELTCPQCDRSFHHKNSLVYHMRSHSGERPHQCEICGKSFFAGSALKVHKRLHSGDKPYKCEDCGRQFRQWGDLKYHSTSLHSEQRQFQCEYCGKDFARKYSLIVHRRIHTGEKNYKCEYCSKTFRASSYLQNHRRIHTGEKPHPCDVCGKPFRVRSDMKRHLLTHSRSANRAERQLAKLPSITKINGDENDVEEDGINKTNRAISDIVRDLKCEMDPNAAVVELVEASEVDENSESILPEFTTVAATQVDGTTTIEVTDDRDPLENVVSRNADALNFDMQLYSINL